MKLSNKGKDLLIKLEGVRLLPYDDQTGYFTNQYCKGATIGIGHLIRDDKEFAMYDDGINMDTAKELLAMDIKPTEEAVAKLVNKPITQQQFDALVLFAFNIGIGGLTHSSVLAMINFPEVKTAYPTLRDAWLAWNKSQGKEMPGLTSRRKIEYALFVSV